jgi:DNA-binding transcriptional ArsR family regulator
VKNTIVLPLQVLVVQEKLRQKARSPHRFYTYLYRKGEGGIPVRELMDALDFSQGTAYTYVNQLVDAGVIKANSDSQPRTYEAVEIDLTLTTVKGDREYTITPALIHAVARRATNETIDSYIDRRGIHGLATALTYTIAREQGKTTHRLMADDLDLSPLEAEVILQALRPVAHEHIDIDEQGASLDDVAAENFDA